MLAAADHPAVLAYCVAIAEHRRLAERVAKRRTPAPAPLARQLRLLAAEIRDAGRYLVTEGYASMKLIGALIAASVK